MSLPFWCPLVLTPPNPPSARFQEFTRKKAGQKKKRNKKKASSPTPSVPDVTSNRFQALSEEEEEEDEEKDQVEMATTQQAPQTVLVVDALAISAQPDTMVEEKEEEEVQIHNSEPDSAYSQIVATSHELPQKKEKEFGITEIDPFGDGTLIQPYCINCPAQIHNTSIRSSR